MYDSIKIIRNVSKKGEGKKTKYQQQQQQNTQIEET